MSAFSPRILKNAGRQLKKLDPPIAKRIVEQIMWLAQHFDKIKPEALKGNNRRLANRKWNRRRKRHAATHFQAGSQTEPPVNKRPTAKVRVRFVPTEEGGRRTVPDLSSGLYRPHLVVGDPSRVGELTDEEALSGSHMLGICFASGPADARLGKDLDCVVELLYPGVDYSPLQAGSGVLVVEGRRIVGSGVVHGEYEAG